MTNKELISKEFTELKQKYPSMRLLKRTTPFPIRFTIDCELPLNCDTPEIRFLLTISENYPKEPATFEVKSNDIPEVVGKKLVDSLKVKTKKKSCVQIAQFLSEPNNLMAAIQPMCDSYPGCNPDGSSCIRWALREGIVTEIQESAVIDYLPDPDASPPPQEESPAPSSTKPLVDADEMPTDEASYKAMMMNLIGPSSLKSKKEKEEPKKKKKKKKQISGFTEEEIGEMYDEDLSEDTIRRRRRERMEVRRALKLQQDKKAEEFTIGEEVKTKKERRAAKQALLGDEEQTQLQDESSSEAGVIPEMHESVGVEGLSSAGVLHSHVLSHDVILGSVTFTFHGVELLVDTTIELGVGKRYGLVGYNGCGKSVMLKALAHGELPLPEWCDTYLLDREAPPLKVPALDYVIQVDKERVEIEKKVAELTGEKKRKRKKGEEDAELTEEELTLLNELYSRLDEIDADKARAKGAEILRGLGFSPDKQMQMTKDMSGGWRMRLSLARALFLRPSLLLLDEPTNHLDLESCVWLENHLKNYERCLVVVSHSQDFLNGVCNRIAHFHKKKINYYTGNYNQYLITRREREENQRRQYETEQAQIADIKEYIARFGRGRSKMAAQAQSRAKQLEHMELRGLTEQIVEDRLFHFKFQKCGTLPSPVIQIEELFFSYVNPEDGLEKDIFHNMSLNVEYNSRVALVGENGSGKSTFLKLIAGDLQPQRGIIRRHRNMRIARYHQHLEEQLDMNLSALRFLLKEFPATGKEDEEGNAATGVVVNSGTLASVEQAMRGALGRYGLSGFQQLLPMKNLSDGQRSRVLFAWMSFSNPHFLLLDEPTNHLDLETIDALADAINEFEGGVLLVSHDFRLIRQIAKEIWVCADMTITPFKGTIDDYKTQLETKLGE
ncbi:putative ABC transporter F family member 1 [Blattamonas nauphoetae]|uniref:ABC transporter F family member 1 n=1 Tax=Blattamonas nauphoetae TaxID=2049346 RepID=A0ABQ9YLE2_9EUKA|nr:putative ABC transporter F family member 1 [Blattamonas nauphoetae]